MSVYGKIYGNEKTSLELSEKAFKVYSNTDYLQIVESYDGLYTINSTLLFRDKLTAQEVNKILEEFYDDWYGDD